MGVTPEEMEAVIRSAIPITHLQILDESSGCGENYSVVIVSEAFEGKNTLARHRMVNEMLKKEISSIHAFTQKTFTPKQWEAQQAKG
ncbi:bola-like protein [Stereum hirsutum FP-91666 SS1]|uniref:bola-like protein n=1 Tax=Stereum hirsutum (strain FP-91666) TaxID=721885 RepID=UPI00044104C3|nr:bola-like protein [Stereum hirsutum FP-91666 SS1]EIM90496.1 bola-like protein [Stereum hirsutum FP-91666 SS1]